MKRHQEIQKNLEDVKGCQQHPRNQICKKKVFITKIENERGEIITSRKGITNVFGECYKNFYDENEQDEYGNENNIDVHISDTEEMTSFPEITSEELQDAIRKRKKRPITSQQRNPS